MRSLELGAAEVDAANTNCRTVTSLAYPSTPYIRSDSAKTPRIALNFDTDDAPAGASVSSCVALSQLTGFRGWQQY